MNTSVDDHLYSEDLGRMTAEIVLGVAKEDSKYANRGPESRARRYGNTTKGGVMNDYPGHTIRPTDHVIVDGRTHRQDTEPFDFLDAPGTHGAHAPTRVARRHETSRASVVGIG